MSLETPSAMEGKKGRHPLGQEGQGTNGNRSGFWQLESWDGGRESRQLEAWDEQRQENRGNSLVVQWLGLCAFTAEGVGLIPGRGTKISQPAHRAAKKNKIKRGKKRQESRNAFSVRDPTVSPKIHMLKP